MGELKHVFGDHYLVELINCDAQIIGSVEGVKASFLQAVDDAGGTILNHAFYQFQPVGVTGFILLKESHFSLHTWPEERYAAFDIFTCGPMLPEKGIDRLKIDFKAGDIRVKKVQRGY